MKRLSRYDLQFAKRIRKRCKVASLCDLSGKDLAELVELDGMKFIQKLVKEMPVPRDDVCTEFSKLCIPAERMCDIGHHGHWDFVLAKMGVPTPNACLSLGMREAYTQWCPLLHQCLPNPLIAGIRQLLLVMRRYRVPRGVQFRIIRTAVLNEYIGQVAPDREAASIHHFQITDTHVVECPRLEWLKNQPAPYMRHPLLKKYPIHTLHPYVSIWSLYEYPETYYYAVTLVKRWRNVPRALVKWVLDHPEVANVCNDQEGLAERLRERFDLD